MITGTYPYLSALVKNHACDEHPEEPLVVVRRPEGTYALACGGVHWMEANNLVRSGNMIYNKDLHEKPKPSTSQEIVKKAEEATAAREETPKEAQIFTLADWYLRLRQFYPQAVVGTRPMSYDDRSPAMLPSDIHAWVAEVFERPQGLMIARSHGYAWVEKDPTGAPLVGPSQWPWQKAEERAEIAAISRAVPLGLEPRGYPEEGGAP